MIVPLRDSNHQRVVAIQIRHHQICSLAHQCLDDLRFAFPCCNQQRCCSGCFIRNVRTSSEMLIEACENISLFPKQSHCQAPLSDPALPASFPESIRAKSFWKMPGAAVKTSESC